MSEEPICEIFKPALLPIINFMSEEPIFEIFKPAPLLVINFPVPLYSYSYMVCGTGFGVPVAFKGPICS